MPTQITGNWGSGVEARTIATVGDAPTAHLHSASDISGTAVLTNDARLTDARTPLSHSHAPSDVTGTAVVNADSRLTNARPPTSLLSSGASGPSAVGYTTGAGGTITQQTNKTTGVTINTLAGQITMNGAALAAAAEVSFTVTNNQVAAVDVPVLAIASGATAGAYLVTVGAVASGSFKVTVSNASAGSLSEAVVLNFVVLKGATS